MKIDFRRGGDAVKKVQVEREIAYESRKNKLWEFFPPKDGTVVQVRFLTEECIVYKCHQIQIGDRWVRVTCTEEFEPGSCKECAKGTSKSQDVGAWLLWDTRSFEVKTRDKNGNETGEKKKVNGSVKPLIRGLTDAALINKKSELYGLLSRPYNIYKTGSGKGSKWTYDNCDPDKLTAKQLDAYLATLPEALRDLDAYEVLEKQITPNETSEDVQEKHSSDERENIRKQLENDVVNNEEPEKVVQKQRKILKRHK